MKHYENLKKRIPRKGKIFTENAEYIEQPLKK